MTTPPRRATPLEPLIDKLEAAEVLDAPAKAVGKRVRDTIPKGAVKDAISGTWLGHAIHPLMTDLVIGSFMSATLLDVLGGGPHAPADDRPRDGLFQERDAARRARRGPRRQRERAADGDRHRRVCPPRADRRQRRGRHGARR